MASESSEGGPVSVAVPPSLGEWLSERVEGSDMEREELVLALLSAYRDATEERPDDVADIVDGRVGPLVDRRLKQYDEDLERRLDDIRRRVVQVKETADGSVSDERFEALSSQVVELESAVSDVRSELEAVDPARVDEHASELEALRESVRTRTETAARLDDRLDDVESKLTRVARAVVALREERTETDERDDGRRMRALSGPDETLVDIKRQAARESIGSADCGACGAAVDLSLLPEAACPHCGVSVRGLEGRDGMFSSPRLVGEGGESDE
jgi:outer membrane murein-binding lipoprotein Lpp